VRPRLLAVAVVALAGCELVAGIDDIELTSASGAGGAGGGPGAGAGGSSGTLPTQDLTFTSSRNAVYVGHDVELSWHAKDASSCSIEPGIGEVEPQGSTTVTPAWPLVTYEIVCDGPAGEISRSLDVAVHGVRDVALGFEHTCALLDNGKVKCWGRNDVGQLGQGHNNHLGDAAGEVGDGLPFVDLGLEPGVTIEAVSAGGGHTCALLSTKDVKCWGNNAFGQLGLDDKDNRGDAVGHMGSDLPIVDLGGPVTSVVAGGVSTCAVLDDQSVKCWGDNTTGQLGQDDMDDRGDDEGEMSALDPVDLGEPALAVAVGAFHTCALTDGVGDVGRIKCWGSGLHGSLGYGASDDRGDQAGEMALLNFVNLGQSTSAAAVATGTNFTCALISLAGKVKCWGFNDRGQLGLGNTTDWGTAPAHMGDNLASIELGQGAVVKQISTGMNHVCAVLDDDQLVCWGEGAEGRLGSEAKDDIGDEAGEMDPQDGPPRVDLGPFTVVKVAAGGKHTCAILDTHELKCWGSNAFGQLGLGSDTPRGNQPDHMGTELPTVDVGL
jgi:alpha-tubulin suppressor-like RCC1 family protein